MQNVKKLSELDVENVQEFMYDGSYYKRDTTLREILNKMFGANLKHAFSNMASDDKTPTILNVGSEHILVVNQKGQFVQLWNSEWGGFEYAN